MMRYELINSSCDPNKHHIRSALVTTICLNLSGIWLDYSASNLNTFEQFHEMHRNLMINSTAAQRLIQSGS